MTEVEKWLRDHGPKKTGNPNRDYMWDVLGMPSSNIFHLLDKKRKTGTPYREEDVVEWRWKCINTYSFSILDSQTLEMLKDHGPYLEVGSGTGYWAWEILRAGVDVVATDPKPYLHISKRKEYPRRQWLIPEKLNATNALKKYPGRTLLMSWPCLEQQWPVNALKAFNGNKLVYVGEWRGCCAEESFFGLLEEEWKTLEERRLIQWEGIHDYLWILERK